MQKLLIATHNPAKIDEIKKYITPLLNEEIQLVSLEDIDITEEAKETGETIVDNARLKAEYYGDLSGLPALADDGGFEITALNGEPGVKSNRWLGRKATDQELIEYTLKRMEDIPEGQRQARLVLCLCYYNPITGTTESVETSIDGHVALKPTEHVVEGFPFRAVHIIEPFNKYYDELTEAEHDQVNHRRKAVHDIAPKIMEDLTAEPQGIVVEEDL